MEQRLQNQKGIEIMNCIYCKGELENTLAIFTIDLENRIIIIKDVPTDICQKCGQRSYKDDVAVHIEHIVSGLRNDHTEVAIIRYRQNNVA